MRLLQAKKLSGHPWEAVRTLKLLPQDYAVFGSAPLLAHGLIAEVGDIDLVAVRSAWRSACSRVAPVVAPGGDEVVPLALGLDVYNGWLCHDIEAVIRRAEVIDGLPIAHLDDVAAYKRLLNRPKDKAHLERLEGYRISRRQERSSS